MTIWPGVSLNSIVMAEMLKSQTSLRLWKWFSFTLKFDHWLVRRLSQKPLISHIPLLLFLHFLNSSDCHYWFLSFHKLHIHGHFGTRTTLFGVSQSTFVEERFLMSKHFIKLLGGNPLYFSISLNNLKIKKFDFWISFG